MDIKSSTATLAGYLLWQDLSILAEDVLSDPSLPIYIFPCIGLIDAVRANAGLCTLFKKMDGFGLL
jgi:hypothetical protein